MEETALQELVFTISTEQPIGAKRDDIRIEGWRDRQNDAHPRLLWTVEVKVGSGLHVSSEQRFEEDSSSVEELVDPELVSQIKNYDHWLSGQKAQHTAGFVLSVGDMCDAMPEGLANRWSCLTWTGLGVEIEEALRRGDLPTEDTFLATHVLGFIKTNLWRDSEMADVRLDLNDVVLIRAYGLLWRECEAKANRLMELIPRLIEKSGVGHGKITSQPKLSDRWEPRSVAYRYIVPGHDNDPEPSFSAGIGYDPRVGDYMGIFFEMGPKFPERQAVVAATTPLLPLLKKRNPQWNMPKSDGQDWCFLENRMPMTNLLGATSQETVLIDAIVRSLDEVKAVGVTEAIIAAVNGKTKTKASE